MPELIVHLKVVPPFTLQQKYSWSADNLSWMELEVSGLLSGSQSNFVTEASVYLEHPLAGPSDGSNDPAIFPMHIEIRETGRCLPPALHVVMLETITFPGG